MKNNNKSIKDTKEEELRIARYFFFLSFEVWEFISYKCKLYESFKYKSEFVNS